MLAVLVEFAEVEFAEVEFAEVEFEFAKRKSVMMFGPWYGTLKNK